MPNPSPVASPGFVAARKKPIGETPNEPLARRSLCIKVGQSTHEKVMALPQAERITWLRRVITEAAQRELMTPPDEPV